MSYLYTRLKRGLNSAHDSINSIVIDVRNLVRKVVIINITASIFNYCEAESCLGRIER